MNTSSRHVAWIEFALLGVLALLWGASYLLTKIAVVEIPPVTLIATRACAAAIFLYIVLVIQGGKLPRDATTWRMLLLQSFFNSIGAWTILAWGQQFVDAGLASVLNSTSPIFVFLLTILVTRHEATGFLKLVGACIGLLGVVFIVGVDALAGLGQQVAGQVAAIVGAILYAFAAIYGRRFSHLTATAAALGTMIWAFIVLIPFSLLFDQPWTLAPSPKAIAATITLGVLCTACALLIYFRLVKTLGSMGVASQAYLRAGIGVVLGVVLLDEHITFEVGLGVAAAIFGVVLINIPTGKSQIERNLNP
jgi:drug/metabolite transporter (DMT)-like permease